MQQPQSRIQAALMSTLLVGALLACKRKADLDPERPLPSVQVPVTAAPPPASPTPLSEEPVRPRPAAPTTRPKVEAEADSEEPSSETPSAAADAGTSAPSEGLPSPGTFIEAGVPSVNQAAQCIQQKCQPALNSCVSVPADGGLPGFGSARACADAFETCRQACMAK